MPYLNWMKQASSGIEFVESKSPRARHEVTLRVQPEHLDSLLLDLQDLYREVDASEIVEARPELRLVVDSQWTFFWKVRSDGNRILLAHPEPDQWVVTIAIEQGFAQNLIRDVSAMSVGAQVKLSAFGHLQAVTNLEVVVSL